jgi:hypothetical protein
MTREPDIQDIKKPSQHSARSRCINCLTLSAILAVLKCLPRKREQKLTVSTWNRSIILKTLAQLQVKQTRSSSTILLCESSPFIGFFTLVSNEPRIAGAEVAEVYNFFGARQLSDLANHVTALLSDSVP